MLIKKIYNIEKFIEDLENLGFEIFFKKSKDKNTIKIYEDNRCIIYINYNYNYVDFISKNN